MIAQLGGSPRNRGNFSYLNGSPRKHESTKAGQNGFHGSPRKHETRVAVDFASRVRGYLNDLPDRHENTKGLQTGTQWISRVRVFRGNWIDLSDRQENTKARNQIKMDFVVFVANVNDLSDRTLGRRGFRGSWLFE
jgi:hypothetical protein